MEYMLLTNSDNQIVGAGYLGNNGDYTITHGINPGDDKIGTCGNIKDSQWNILPCLEEEYNEQCDLHLYSAYDEDDV